MAARNHSFIIFDLIISMPINVEEIIKGCIDGDRKYQKQLYEHFASKMLGICMRYAKDKAEAEDMMQEGFVKVFMSIKNFRNEGNFEGWVKRIMVYNAINMFKIRKRKFRESLDSIDADGIVENNMIEIISAKEIVTLIQQMPEGYRLIFNLFAVEGYTHREISELLEISEGTSKSQYSRARQFMKAALTKHYKILNEPFREPK